MRCKPGEENWVVFSRLFLSEYGDDYFIMMGDLYKRTDVEDAYLAMPDEFTITFKDASTIVFECLTSSGEIRRFVDRIWQW